MNFLGSSFILTPFGCELLLLLKQFREYFLILYSPCFAMDQLRCGSQFFPFLWFLKKRNETKISRQASIWVDNFIEGSNHKKNFYCNTHTHTHKCTNLKIVKIELFWFWKSTRHFCLSVFILIAHFLVALCLISFLYSSLLYFPFLFSPHSFCPN